MGRMGKRCVLELEHKSGINSETGKGNGNVTVEGLGL